MKDIADKKYDGNVKNISFDEFVDMLGLVETVDGDFIPKKIEDSIFNEDVKDNMEELYNNIMHISMMDDCCCDRDPFEEEEYTITVTKTYKKEIDICASNKEEAVMTLHSLLMNDDITFDESDIESMTFDIEEYI
jgi:hypothetical protein